MSKVFSFIKRFLVVCVVLLIASQSVHAANLDLNFTLVNRSGLEISRLYLSPSEFSKWDWELDEITGRGLPVRIGNTLRINMSNNAERQKFRHWDMRVVFNNGRYWEFHTINLSSITQMTINVDGRGIDNYGKYYMSTKNQGK